MSNGVTVGGALKVCLEALNLALDNDVPKHRQALEFLRDNVLAILLNGNLPEEVRKELAVATFLTTPPAAGQRWQHYKGGHYTVLAAGLHEATLLPMVAYRSEERGHEWFRSLGNFVQRVELTEPLEVRDSAGAVVGGGTSYRAVSRFTRVGP